jgi:hypothetical protein
MAISFIYLFYFILFHTCQLRKEAPSKKATSLKSKPPSKSNIGRKKLLFRRNISKRNYNFLRYFERN